MLATMVGEGLPLGMEGRVRCREVRGGSSWMMEGREGVKGEEEMVGCEGGGVNEREMEVEA